MAYSGYLEDDRRLPSVERRMKAEKPTVLILYHYFYPDDVASALHFSDLCKELCARGWRVIAMPCNRGCRRETDRFTRWEHWNGVEIRRVWRPRFRQAGKIGRLLNAVWMIVAWSIAALRRGSLSRVDVLIVGTDPVLSVLVARVWKALRSRTKIVHWCFDLYPDAAVADGILRDGTLLHRVIQRLLLKAYDRCDLIVDIGACMRKKLQASAPGIEKTTLTPQALVEPDDWLPVDFDERRRVFGDTRLALLYSGNFGRAHCCDMFLQLARRLRTEDVKFAFSIRGNRADAVAQAISRGGKNVVSVPFASLERLQARLAAADIHLVSLREGWTGAAVPSKFFGSLAIGRPVIFAGSEHSAIAEWIRTYDVGWVLTEQTLEYVARRLLELSDRADQLWALQLHCHQVYRDVFSREKTMDSWDAAIRRLVSA